MTQPVPPQLSLLLIEDSEDDAELVEHELRRHGYDVSARRVCSEPALRDALGSGHWDVALSDHNLPGFASPEAQAIVNAVAADVPFVILSGTIGEEATVEALRSGARDVVLKSNLSRLGLVVDRVLADSEQRRRHREAELELEESERAQDRDPRLRPRLRGLDRPRGSHRRLQPGGRGDVRLPRATRRWGSSWST